jgi:hypothetical protein
MVRFFMDQMSTLVDPSLTLLNPQTHTEVTLLIDKGPIHLHGIEAKTKNGRLSVLLKVEKVRMYIKRLKAKSKWKAKCSVCILKLIFKPTVNLFGNAANCPGSQLVVIFQLSLCVVPQLAEFFKS